MQTVIIDIHVRQVGIRPSTGRSPSTARLSATHFMWRASPVTQWIPSMQAAPPKPMEQSFKRPTTTPVAFYVQLSSPYCLCLVLEVGGSAPVQSLRLFLTETPLVFGVDLREFMTP